MQRFKVIPVCCIEGRKNNKARCPHAADMQACSGHRTLPTVCIGSSAYGTVLARKMAISLFVGVPSIMVGAVEVQTHLMNHPPRCLDPYYPSILPRYPQGVNPSFLLRPTPCAAYSTLT